MGKIYRIVCFAGIGLLAFAGCDEDDGDTDAGTRDSGGNVDGGTADGSTIEDGGPGDAGPDPMGQVRFWHLAAAANDVDLFVDGEEAVADFGFENNTDYIDLPAGMHDFAVAPADAGIDAAVIEVDDFMVAAGASYTIVAAQLDPDPEAEGAFAAIPITDDNSDPASGEVGIRVFHAAYAVGNAVNVHDASGERLPAVAVGLGQGEVAEDRVDREATALRFALDIGPDGELGATDGAIDLLTEEIDAPPSGALLTVGVINKPGEEAGETETEVVFLVNSGENIHDEVELEPAGQVRVWHLAAEAGVVDLLVDGEGTEDDWTVEDVDFEATTGFAALPAGTYDISVTPDGASDPAIEVDGFELAAGQAFTIVAIQLDEDEEADDAFSALAIEQDLSTPADDNIRFRVFHAAFDVAGAVDVHSVDGDTDPELIDDLGQGEVADALEVANLAYTFGLDTDDDGTHDLETAAAVDMPPAGSTILLGVISKPDGGVIETEVVFLVNDGLHDEVELEAPEEE